VGNRWNSGVCIALGFALGVALSTTMIGVSQSTEGLLAVLEKLAVILTALGSVAVFAVAIWGDWIKAQLFPISLSIASGRLTDNPVQLNTGRHAWFYHLPVRNERRFPSASQVQLLMLSLEQINPITGVPSLLFSEPLPMWWQRGEVLPVMRTVGPEAIAVIFYVTDPPSQFTFTPLVKVSHFPPSFTRAVTLRLTVQARAIEGDSAAVRLRIEWDGGWSPNSSQMTNHLAIKQDPL
jgi:hypothetical protein